MKATATLLAFAALTGCSTAPGTGWSRAPDLSVYSSMTLIGDVAQEQSILCSGFGTASVRSDWDEDFGGRHQAVVAALAARHGPAAVDRAEAAALPTRRVACPDWPNDRWRNQYVRMLRLLEARLGLA
jgi:hypothetical protein